MPQTLFKLIIVRVPRTAMLWIISTTNIVLPKSDQGHDEGWNLGLYRCHRSWKLEFFNHFSNITGLKDWSSFYLRLEMNAQRYHCYWYVYKWFFFLAKFRHF
ncbi:hypothetical protein CY35_02G202300 [Sphagnum magellanicum]|nr:hypothetical protein CY35_02G202300 [Sphagnum magellanicum]